jgi:hypothetical protein
MGEKTAMNVRSRDPAVESHLLEVYGADAARGLIHLL